MRGAKSRAFVFTIMICLLAGLGLAQEEDLVGSDEELPNFDLAAFELSGGYSQFVGGRMTYKRDALGFAISGAYDQAGIFAAIQGRAYLPLDVLLPVYLGVGGGFLQNGPLINVGAGTHIPLGLDGWRLSVEAGTNWVFNDDGGMQPYGSVAIGYSFLVDPAFITVNSNRAAELAAQDPATCTPSRSDLVSRIREGARERIARALSNVEGVSDLEYSYSNEVLEIDGDEAELDLKWRGSAIVSGDKVSASGSLSMEFGWEPCRWYLIDYDFTY